MPRLNWTDAENNNNIWELSNSECEYCDNKFFKRYLTPWCSWQKEIIKMWMIRSPLPLFNLMSVPFLPARPYPCPCPNSCTLKFTHNPFSDIIGWQQVPCPSRIFKDLDARYFVIKVFQGWSLKILKVQGEDKDNVFKGNLNQFKVYGCWNFNGSLRVSLENPQISRQGRG